MPFPRKAALPAACWLLLLPAGLGAETVDFTRLPAFVRPGFADDWVKAPRGNAVPAPAGPEWRRLAGSPRGDRRIRMANQRFPDFPRRRPLSFSLERFAPRTMTILLPFELKERPDPGRATGLLLGHIGQRWEIYLNGQKLAGRMDSDRIAVVRNLLLPVPNELLRPGDNRLALRIEGDPASAYTGLYRGKPYLLGPFDELLAARSDRVQLVLIFIYLFTGLLHVFLFLRRPTEAYNLWFGLFSVFMFAYFSSRHQYLVEWITDFDLLRRLELGALFLAIPLAGTFFESILIERLGKMTAFNYVYSALLVVLILPWSPLPFTQDVLRVWQFTTVAIFIPFYVFYRLGGQLLLEGRRLQLREPDLGWSAILWRVFFHTVPGNLSLGALVLVACTIYDILDSIYFALGLRASQFGFLFFVVGIILILANRFQRMHLRVADLNVHLQEKIADLGRVNEKLKTSEEQYRRLINGSTEIIFTLDESGRLLTVNRAFFRQLQYRPDKIGELNVRDLLYAGAKDRGMARGLLEQKLEKCRKDGGNDRLRLVLETSRGEPLELELSLERLRGEEHPEILCRGVRLREDSLLRYFVSEKQKYRIENFLIAAEEISQRLVRNAVKYLEPDEIPSFRVALREVIINAIEHGNLGITYDEKNESLLADRYQDFIAERQRRPENRDKKVGIEFVLTPQKIVYYIADEGAGFDYRKTREKALQETGTDRQHGRGILITEQVFDEVHYNERGNEVMLVKYFRNGSATAGA